MKTVEKLLKNSIETDLCCHCGTCAGVCPVGAIEMGLHSISVSPEKCVDCGLCTYVCPSKGYALSDLTCEDIKEMPKFMACSVDKKVSANASSGGFVTQTLLSLLDKGDITAAAVVVAGRDMTEASAKYILATQQEDILAARRSKYTQASIHSVIDHIKNNDGKYAIVGLPCQLYAITKATERMPILKSRITYKIGMVCGYTYDEACIDGLLKVLGTSRESTESIVGWREGGLPGNFSVKLKNGDILSMPFADEHSVDVTYFAQNRCLQCKDCLCEFGDVVCADIGGWANRRTLVMPRTERGQRLLDKVQSYGSLKIEPCDRPFEKTVLPFMLKEKRARVDLRIQKNKKRDLPTTNFAGGYSPKLLLSQKISAIQSEKLQEYARKKRDAHSREKMLKIGHQSYHKLSERFTMKVLFKLQMWTSAACVCAKKLLRRIWGKFCALLPTVSFGRDNKPLKVAVVGLGRWGSQYLSVLKKANRFNLVAAYDYDRKKLEMYSKKYGFSAAESVADLCKNYGAEAILILTPTPTHADVFSEVSQYSLPVYMEKPIASNMAETRQMGNVADKKDILLYVAHSMKYEPAIQKMKHILDSGDLGEISKVKIVRTVKSKNNTYYPNAALYQIGVHVIDVLQYLLNDLGGSSDFSRRVNGYIETVTFLRGETEISLRYGFGTFYNFSLQLVCENGYVSLADGVLKTVINGEETVYKIPMKNEKTICDQLDEFYYAVSKGKSYLNTKENAERIMSVCEQIIESGENI